MSQNHQSSAFKHLRCCKKYFDQEQKNRKQKNNQQK